ncbi:hypothetical protein [Jiella pelagia]|uniref:Uncharacterized protein n=1 Tax=Jiella pelagia TaxID=2986949 RepID=A0ABY7C5G6_9HYPH|nr:hypothetical protein [Jiella pelagia]WAP68974.1 hypothetical protein OH818_01125 [Jiella pelagia]WAP70575.1 hypothetical protein OH818_11415 [Jiella pelagia]
MKLDDEPCLWLAMGQGKETSLGREGQSPAAFVSLSCQDDEYLPSLSAAGRSHLRHVALI